MKELIRVRVRYASRQQCCKTHKRPLPLPFTDIATKQATNERNVMKAKVNVIDLASDSLCSYSF